MAERENNLHLEREIACNEERPKRMYTGPADMFLAKLFLFFLGQNNAINPRFKLVHLSLNRDLTRKSSLKALAPPPNIFN
jgi:hypothetical protein